MNDWPLLVQLVAWFVGAAAITALVRWAARHAVRDVMKPDLDEVKKIAQGALDESKKARGDLLAHMDREEADIKLEVQARLDREKYEDEQFTTLKNGQDSTHRRIDALLLAMKAPTQGAST